MSVQCNPGFSVAAGSPTRVNPDRLHGRLQLQLLPGLQGGGVHLHSDLPRRRARVLRDPTIQEPRRARQPRERRPERRKVVVRRRRDLPLSRRRLPPGHVLVRRQLYQYTLGYDVEKCHHDTYQV